SARRRQRIVPRDGADDDRLQWDPGADLQLTIGERSGGGSLPDRASYSIARTSLCIAPNPATSATAAPPTANVHRTLHSPARQATAMEIGIRPNDESIRTLLTRPRTERSTRCCSHAWSCTLMKPARPPMNASKRATGQKPVKSPTHAIASP